MEQTQIKSKQSFLKSSQNFASNLCELLKSYLFKHNPNTKRYWNRKLHRFNNGWRDSNYHLILELFPEKKPFSILDVGCALGDGCELIQNKLPLAHVSGVDFSEVGISKARQKNNDVQYHLLDVLKDPLPETYDFITIVQTLEHFDNPFPIVDKCLNHVRDSVIITVPYKENALLGHAEHRYTFDEGTFKGYQCKIVCKTDTLTACGSRCIVYRISA